jgi:hypothetical protein
MIDLPANWDRMSIGTLWETLNDQRRHGRAAQSTIDALMYSLRSGTSALKRQDVRQRIAAVDEKQMQDICKHATPTSPSHGRRRKLQDFLLCG